MKKENKEFTIKDLPQTRKDQYSFLIKNQYFSLLKMGLLCLLFSITFILTSVIKDFFNFSFYNQVKAQTLEENEYHTYFLLDTMLANLINYLFLPVFAIFVSGTNRILRKMVQGDYVLFKDEFKLGIKSNYSITCIILMLFGFIFLLHQFIITYFQRVYFIVPSFLIIILLIIPISLTFILYSSYYKETFFHGLTNSMKIYVYSWWKFLLISLFLIAVLYSLDSIPLYYLKVIIMSLVCIFIYPLFSLLSHEIGIDDFDNLINSEYYPEQLNKGLYQSTLKKGKAK